MSNIGQAPASARDLLAATREFQHPDGGRSARQLLTSVLPYLALLFVMWYVGEVSVLLALVVAVPTAGFMLRSFIVFHDATHGSLFRNRSLNDAIGSILGVMTFTPFKAWQSSHARHHASAGDLDRRGMGDVWTLTVAEYRASPLWRKILYRLYRDPFVFVLLGTANFVIISRTWPKGTSARERNSILLTNLGIAAMAAGGIWLVGLQTYLFIQLSSFSLAAAAGIWLFYVQHQYEGVYWARGGQWTFADAALVGSSYYRLPKLLQYFTGNIGFHHVHHLNPRVPNYYLERCHRGHPDFEKVPVLTLAKSLKSLSLRLFDEDTGRLVGFRHLRRATAVG
jgi:omega-6 fatty acid desaturase (delta-12 desaturase)